MATKSNAVISLLFVIGAWQFYGAILVETRSAYTGVLETSDEVNALIKDNNDTVLIVDVREPYELIVTGSIPGSINIPLNSLESNLKNFTANEFSQKYHTEKPKLDTILIFTCTKGVRSDIAKNIATGLGYTNAKNYLGGWSDWESRGNYCDRKFKGNCVTLV